MGPRNDAMAQWNGSEDPFLTTVLVSFVCWAAGELFLLVDETIRSVAIHMFGVGN
jgi:hypothetical protein